MSLDTLLFRSLDSTLKVIKDEKYKDKPQVQTLLGIYEDAKSKYENSPRNKVYPLIVLEGLDGSGKTTITKKLANRLEAELYRTPPSCIRPELRAAFEDDKLLRTAFYCLCNYIAAYELMDLLETRIVVLDRFWHSSAAFAIAQEVHNNAETLKMPANGDPIYKWPEDLLKPDVVFLLSVSEAVREQRQSRRIERTTQETLLNDNKQFRDNVLLAYKNMVDPKIDFINGNPGVSVVLRDLQKRIQPFLCE